MICTARGITNTISTKILALNDLIRDLESTYDPNLNIGESSTIYKKSTCYDFLPSKTKQFTN